MNSPNINLVIFDFDDTLVVQDSMPDHHTAAELADLFRKLFAQRKLVCICTGGTNATLFAERYPESLIVRYNGQIIRNRVMIFDMNTRFSTRYTSNTDLRYFRNCPAMKSGHG